MAAAYDAPQSSFYELSATDIKGNLFPFQQLQGKACLVVNVASKVYTYYIATLGTTEEDNLQLVTLQQRYRACSCGRCERAHKQM